MADHKDPTHRKHLWERPERRDEQARAEGSAYALDLPRFLHKDGAEKYVSSPDECDAALADGWHVDPNNPPKADDEKPAKKRKE